MQTEVRNTFIKRKLCTETFLKLQKINWNLETMKLRIEVNRIGSSLSICVFEIRSSCALHSKSNSIGPRRCNQVLQKSKFHYISNPETVKLQNSETPEILKLDKICNRALWNSETLKLWNSPKLWKCSNFRTF